MKMKKCFKEIFNINKTMNDIEFYSKPELLERAKEMGLKGFHTFNKARLLKLIKNPPLESLTKSVLLERAKEVGLQDRYRLKNKELIELIRNPPPPHVRYTGVKKKVILQPVDTEGKAFVFPSINAAAKHFNVNPGSFGWKVASKKEETKNTIVIDGIKYKLRFESYTLKKCKD